MLVSISPFIRDWMISLEPLDNAVCCPGMDLTPVQVKEEKEDGPPADPNAQESAEEIQALLSRRVAALVDTTSATVFSYICQVRGTDWCMCSRPSPGDQARMCVPWAAAADAGLVTARQGHSSRCWCVVPACLETWWKG